MKKTSRFLKSTLVALARTQILRLSCSLGTFGTLAAVALLIGGLGMPDGNAQNEAQRNALAHLRDRHQVTSSTGQEASSVSLHVPRGVAFDGPGNLYIADTGDNL